MPSEVPSSPINSGGFSLKNNKKEESATNDTQENDNNSINDSAADISIRTNEEGIVSKQALNALKVLSDRGQGGEDAIDEEGGRMFNNNGFYPKEPKIQVFSDDVSSLHYEDHNYDEAEEENVADTLAASEANRNSDNANGNVAREEKAQGYENYQEYDKEPLSYGEETDEMRHQRVVRRRNILIIIMLLVFLAMVGAIGFGVGIAVKNSNDADNASGGGEEQAEDGDAIMGEIETSPPSPAPTLGPCIPLELGIIFDEYAVETSWKVVEGEYIPDEVKKAGDGDANSNNATQVDESNVVWESKFYPGDVFNGRAETFHNCLSEGIYSFVFMDRESDGICCNHGDGLYVLSSEGKVITIGGEMDSKEEYVTFDLAYIEPAPVDTNNGGLDDRLGLIMPFDSSELVEGVNCENFHLVIETDQYGLETTWELYNGTDKLSGNMIANGGPYGSEYTYVIDYCLPAPQAYTLYVYDWARDGLCCDTGGGWYKLSSGNTIIHESDGQFGSEEVTNFGLPADTVTPSSSPSTLPPSLSPSKLPSLPPTTSPTMTLPPSSSPFAATTTTTTITTLTIESSAITTATATTDGMTSSPIETADLEEPLAADENAETTTTSSTVESISATPAIGMDETTACFSNAPCFETGETCTSGIETCCGTSQPKISCSCNEFGVFACLSEVGCGDNPFCCPDPTKEKCVDGGKDNVGVDLGDECDAVGEECGVTAENGVVNVGWCCLDKCSRKYCAV